MHLAPYYLYYFPFTTGILHVEKTVSLGARRHGLGFGLSLPAHAQFLERVELKPAVVSGFLSRHIGTAEQFNESNHGIGYRFGDSDVIVGYFRNSLDRDSLYAAYEARWQLWGPLQVGVAAGLATGYKYAVTPVLTPELVLQVRGVELALAYIPEIHNVTPTTIATQVRYSW